MSHTVVSDDFTRTLIADAGRDVVIIGKRGREMRDAHESKARPYFDFDRLTSNGCTSSITSRPSGLIRLFPPSTISLRLKQTKWSDRIGGRDNCLLLLLPLLPLLLLRRRRRLLMLVFSRAA